mmetsp:Transcript_18889/g.23164  ORF Transcript_18889/g.23164 Transcript_18889/m.23164 type:complete len:337 (+) Transcript_18889:425-1435(+)
MSMVSGTIQNEQQANADAGADSDSKEKEDDILEQALDEISKSEASGSKSFPSTTNEAKDKTRTQQKETAIINNEVSTGPEKATWEKKWEASLSQAKKDEDKAALIIERVNAKTKESEQETPADSGLRFRGTYTTKKDESNIKEEKENVALHESKETKALRIKLRQASLIASLRVIQLVMIVVYACFLSFQFTHQKDVLIVSAIENKASVPSNKADEFADEVLIDFEDVDEIDEFDAGIVTSMVMPPPLSGWVSVPISIFCMYLLTKVIMLGLYGRMAPPFFDTSSEGMIETALRNFGGPSVAKALGIQKFLFLCVNDFFLVVFVFVLCTTFLVLVK